MAASFYSYVDRLRHDNILKVLSCQCLKLLWEKGYNKNGDHSSPGEYAIETLDRVSTALTSSRDVALTESAVMHNLMRDMVWSRPDYQFPSVDDLIPSLACCDRCLDYLLTTDVLASPNQLDSHGKDVLYYVITRLTGETRLACLRVLVSHRTNLDTRYNTVETIWGPRRLRNVYHQRTALLIVLSNEHTFDSECFDFLLSHGADPRLPDEKGLTLIHHLENLKHDRRKLWDPRLDVLALVQRYVQWWNQGEFSREEVDTDLEEIDNIIV